MTDLPIGRNTALLSAALAANSGMLQLQAAVASLTLVQVLGIDGLLGLGPAIVLASARSRRRLRAARWTASAVCPCWPGVHGWARGRRAGRDRLYRRRGRARAAGLRARGGGQRHGVAGPHRSRRHVSARAPGPRDRARAVWRRIRAILGPAVFSPLLHGKHLDGDALAPLWLAGSGFMLVALVLVLMVRPDPKRIAELLHTGDPPPDTRVPLREILARPGVIPHCSPPRRASA